MPSNSKKDQNQLKKSTLTIHQVLSLRLKPIEFMTLVLISNTYRVGEILPTGQIADLIGVSSRQVQRVLKSLMDKNLMSLDRTSGNRQVLLATTLMSHPTTYMSHPTTLVSGSQKKVDKNPNSGHVSIIIDAKHPEHNGTLTNAFKTSCDGDAHSERKTIKNQNSSSLSTKDSPPNYIPEKRRAAVEKYGPSEQGHYVWLTPEEVQALNAEHGEGYTEFMVTQLLDWADDNSAKFKKRKNHYRTIKKWHSMAVARGEQFSTVGPSGPGYYRTYVLDNYYKELASEYQ